MRIDWPKIFFELKDLEATLPTIADAQDAMIWGGKLYALTRAMNEPALSARVGSDLPILSNRMLLSKVILNMTTVLYQALALAEQNVPTVTSGSFIPTNGHFEAFSYLGRIFKNAKRDILIVDPYLDDTALTDFCLLANEGTHIRLLADAQGVKASLNPAVKRWSLQYSQKRPLTVKVAPPKTLHDRSIFIDQNEAWILTQSLKDIAQRSPASITKVDADLTSMKIQAYEEIWEKSEELKIG